MKFNYQARTKVGEVQVGTIEASNKESALFLLKSHGFFVTVLEEVSLPFYARELKIFKRISKKEIVSFSRQIAILFKSEVPLIEVLETLAKQTSNTLLKEKILDMISRVEGGISLSKIFGNYPEIFNSFYVHMVKTGEISGKLSETFNYLADHLEREYDFQEKIKGAMFYPCFVLIVFIIILTIISYFVLPLLITFFEEAGIEYIPWSTKLVIAFSHFVKTSGWIVILMAIGLIVFVIYYLKTKEGQDFFGKYSLKIPFLNNFLRKIYLTRFALNLSTLISGGLSITQALEICENVIGNIVYKKIISDVNDGIKRGQTMSDTLQKYSSNVFPLFVQMTAVGEKTGKLSSCLMNIVDYYQKDIDRTVNNLTNILEPVILVVLGIMVAILVFSIFLPIFQVLQNI